MVGDGVISCAYRLLGRLSPEAHSDLPGTSRDSAALITRGVAGDRGDMRGNLVLLSFCFIFSSR